MTTITNAENLWQYKSKLSLNPGLSVQLYYCRPPIAGLNPATLLRKRLSRRCFPVNFAKSLRTLFSQGTYKAMSSTCSL